MDFTFGIITAGNNEQSINSIIDSIENQNIERYEIVIIGSCNIVRDNTRVINFEESQRKAWITKKKNMITNHARYENVVYMHDYFRFEEGWYVGFKKFGNDFKLCMNILKNENGDRYRDWSLWAGDAVSGGVPERTFLLPYEETGLSKYMYFSGAYWVAKRDIMKEFSLDESLCWGQGEDVEWSSRVRKKYNFSMNKNSISILTKYKPPIFTLISDEDLLKFKAKVGA